MSFGLVNFCLSDPSLSILKLNICWAKSTDKLALHPADYLAVENGCLKIEIRVLKLLNGLKAIYEQNLRPPLKDQASNSIEIKTFKLELEYVFEKYE